MEVEIIEAAMTCTVADIEPGKRFVYAGTEFMKVADDYNRNVNCVCVNGWFPDCVSPAKIVEPRDPPAPKTCTFGELKQGDLYMDDGDTCMRTEPMRGVRLSDGLHFTNYPRDLEVTRLRQVVALKVQKV